VWASWACRVHTPSREPHPWAAASNAAPLTRWRVNAISQVRHLLVDDRVTAANAGNLRAATTAALLLLPHTFDESQLHAALCGLSYTGDVRMALAEDRHKVRVVSSERALNPPSTSSV
jgi:hypothetical protein